MRRSGRWFAVLVVAGSGLALVGCGSSGGGAAAPTVSATPTPVTISDAEVRAWCKAPTETSTPTPLPGPSDQLAPDDASALVVCPPAMGWPEAGSAATASVEQSSAKVAAVVKAFNDLPASQDPQACTLIGGGDFATIFVGPGGNAVRVDTDNVNCQQASNGVTNRTGASEAVDLLAAIAADPTTRTVTLSR